MKGYTYILRCANGRYYTGSTKDLEKRICEHQNGEGSNFTKKISLLNLFIMRNTKGLMKLFTGKNKYRGGVARKRKQ